MDWAARRRFLIFLIVGAVVVSFLAVVIIAALYKTPSCADGIANQDEAGIDCGGPCAYLCSFQILPPTVLFTKVLNNGSDRIDIIAEIENKNNEAAAKNVPYSITLFDKDQIFIREITGTIDLPPGETIPVFVTGVASEKQQISSAFLNMETSAPQWFVMEYDPRIVPVVLRTTRGGTTQTPRIESILMNQSGIPLTNVQAIVVVRNAKKDVIAASETVVPVIPSQGQSTAIFTWNSAFSSVPASIEVVPIIPLPDR